MAGAWQAYMTPTEARVYEREGRSVHELRKKIQEVQSLRSRIYERAKSRRRYERKVSTTDERG